ncbi:MAG: hypothetical protein WC799_05665 [Desulfobacteraceae bacterium]|jgi:hypothetical protein
MAKALDYQSSQEFGDGNAFFFSDFMASKLHHDKTATPARKQNPPKPENPFNEKKQDQWHEHRFCCKPNVSVNPNVFGWAGEKVSPIDHSMGQVSMEKEPISKSKNMFHVISR